MSIKNEAWSMNNKDFVYHSLDELLIDQKEKLAVGNKVYVGVDHQPVLSDFCDADDVIEIIQRQGAAICGECSDHFIHGITEDSKQELDKLLSDWMAKHVNTSVFTKMYVREHTLTGEDMMV